MILAPLLFFGVVGSEQIPALIRYAGRRRLGGPSLRYHFAIEHLQQALFEQA